MLANYRTLVGAHANRRITNIVAGAIVALISLAALAYAIDSFLPRPERLARSGCTGPLHLCRGSSRVTVHDVRAGYGFGLRYRYARGDRVPNSHVTTGLDGVWARMIHIFRGSTRSCR